MNDPAPIGDNKQTVSVVVLAFNEEQDLRASVEGVIAAAADVPRVAIEIIIVNDGSSDGTASVARALESEHRVVRSVHHETNQGFGAAFRTGLNQARCEWITFWPGDNIVSSATLRSLFAHAGEADMVCAFPINTEYRPRARQILSSAFAFIYKNTFNVHLRSVHTTPLYSVSQLRATRLRSTGYSLPSEIMIKLLRHGCTYMELPGYLNPAQNRSAAVKLRNLVEVFTSFAVLILEVYVTHRDEYAHTPRRVIPAELRPTSNRPVASS